MELENMSNEELMAKLKELQPLAEEQKQKEIKAQKALIEKQNKALEWWTDPEGKMAKAIKEKGVSVTLTHKDCVTFTDGTIVKWSGRGYRKIN